VALALVTVVAMATMRDVDLLSPAIALSALIGVNLIIVLLPYTALMALVSTIARSARQATVYAIILWIAMALVINWVVPRVPEIAFVEWFLPGSQLYELLQREGWDTLSLVHIPALQSVVLLFLGRTLMRRGDL
ncbi:MAG: ABC transporter, partial [Pseudomonadota bacterium]